MQLKGMAGTDTDTLTCCVHATAKICMIYIKALLTIAMPSCTRHAVHTHRERREVREVPYQKTPQYKLPSALMYTCLLPVCVYVYHIAISIPAH